MLAPLCVITQKISWFLGDDLGQIQGCNPTRAVDSLHHPATVRRFPILLVPKLLLGNVILEAPLALIQPYEAELLIWGSQAELGNQRNIGQIHGDNPPRTVDSLHHPAKTVRRFPILLVPKLLLGNAILEAPLALIQPYEAELLIWGSQAELGNQRKLLHFARFEFCE